MIGYHTQEHRSKELSAPVRCCDKEAWLGYGYYFWQDEEFAHYWGKDMKVGRDRKGSYDIYTAEIDLGMCLDTVYNEEHYLLFCRLIEYAINHFKKLGKEPKLWQIYKKLHDDECFIKTGIQGIRYCDTPTGYRHNVIYPLYYKKRIQFVLFKDTDCHDFKIYKSKLS